MITTCFPIIVLVSVSDWNTSIFLLVTKACCRCCYCMECACCYGQFYCDPNHPAPVTVFLAPPYRENKIPQTSTTHSAATLAAWHKASSQFFCSLFDFVLIRKWAILNSWILSIVPPPETRYVDFFWFWSLFWCVFEPRPLTVSHPCLLCTWIVVNITPASR